MNRFLTKKIRNPAQGVRGHRPRSTCPAWGVSSLATDRTAGDLLRGSLARVILIWQRLRIAQLRKAREGLPVNFAEDGAELRMTLAGG